MYPVLSNYKKILHFSRLSKLGVKQELAITIHEAADIMFTSPRHCRTLLNEMRELAWLEWTPKAGRSQRSRLYLRFSLDELQIEMAQQLIGIGKYEKALAVIDHDQQLFGQLLQNTSGAIQREGRLHIQLTYARSFSALLPHIALRNSERFLIRQVYCCLVQCDEDGLITPQLAHHWVYNAQLSRWRFYLRPALTFHDGSDIDAYKVAELFKRLKELSTYKAEMAHITDISAVQPLCIEFKFDQLDPGFAGLIASVKYSIQPYAQLNAAVGIVGSGAFRVHEHSQQYLRLKAFDNFYGYRALTDTVTIWRVLTPQISSFCTKQIQANTLQKNSQIQSNYPPKNFPDLKDEYDIQASESAQKTRIEYGCLLAMINTKSKLSLLQRKYLSQLLATEKLMAILSLSPNPVEAIPAYNLLFNWLKVMPTGIEEQPLPSKLTIATFEHHTLNKCAQAMMTLLNQAGIDCKIKVYSFEELVEKANSSNLTEDLTLISLDLDDNLPTSIYQWMLSDAVFNESLSKSACDWLQNKLIRIRQQQPLTCYLSELESISTAMITEHWMIPILHHRQTLYFKDVLKNVSINVWGWPEIQDVWSEQFVDS